MKKMKINSKLRIKRHQVEPDTLLRTPDY